KRKFLCALCVSAVKRLLGFYHLAAAQAAGAHADALGGAVDAGAHRAQVDVPAPFGHVVRVTDIVPRLRLLAADITNLCHDGRLQKSSELVGQKIDFTAVPADSPPGGPFQVVAAGALARRHATDRVDAGGRALGA